MYIAISNRLGSIYKIKLLGFVRSFGVVSRLVLLNVYNQGCAYFNVFV